MSGKLKLWAKDIRKFLQSGLYRQFDAAGRLLYIGETDNFLARSDLKRSGRWDLSFWDENLLATGRWSAITTTGV